MGLVQTWYGYKSLLPPINSAAINETQGRISELKSSIDGVLFLNECARRLKLSQTVISTSAVLFHRYCKVNAEKIDFELASTACLFLATKVVEEPRKLRDVINIANAVRSRDEGILLADNKYWGWKEDLLKTEQAVLRALHFNVEVQLPYLFLFNYSYYLRCSVALVRTAWELINDLYYSPQSLQLPPFVLAASAIEISSILLEEKVQGQYSEPWYYVLDTSNDDIVLVAEILQKIAVSRSKRKTQ